MAPNPNSFAAILGARLADDAGQPLVTAYDEAAGSRVELSVKTYANWVDKTANLLMDEYLLGDGDAIRVELPPHWLGTVFLGAALTAGIALTTDPGTPAHLIVRGPDRLEDDVPDVPVLACSLTPFATPFTGPLPDGIDDYGTLWPGQPDGFTGTPGDPTTTACRHDGSRHSQAEVIERAARSADGWNGARMLTDNNPLDDCGASSFLAALVCGGSMVLVSNPTDDQWPARHEGERATDLLRSSSPG